MKPIPIGHTIADPQAPVTVDAKSLIANRLLIQANSGGGKSNTIRLLVERMSPHLPCIIIDPEGEFSTLREKVDLVLVGDGGELAASPKNAGELAIKLLSLGVSAVIDIFSLSPADKREYVRRYCENIIAAPRTLWRPFMLVIDEAQIFCPEKSDSVSTLPVTHLMTLARKREICAVLATPRLAQIDTDARGPINNFLIGRATLDVDYKRAGEILGMPHAERRSLASLKMGQFHAFGPSFGHDGVALVKLDEAETKPPKSGKASTHVPSPSAAILSVVPELEKIATAENPDEVSTIEKARARIKELSKALTTAERASKTVTTSPTVSMITPEQIDRYRNEGRREAARGIGSLIKGVGQRADALERLAKSLASEAESTRAMVGSLQVLVDGAAKMTEVAAAGSEAQPGRPTNVLPAKGLRATSTPKQPNPGDPRPGTDLSLGKGERTVLIAVAQYPQGASREQLSILTGYKRSSRDTYLQRLRSSGYVDESSDGFVASDAGVAALGANYQPLPTGDDLREWWLERLPEGERRVLEVLIAHHPDGAERDAVSEATGYKRSSRDTYIQRLTTRRIVEVKNGRVYAAQELFS